MHDVTKFTLYDEVMCNKLARAVRECEVGEVNQAHLAVFLSYLYDRLLEMNLALRKIDSCSTSNPLTGIYTVQSIIKVLKDLSGDEE